MSKSKIVAYGLIDNRTGELLHGRIYLKVGTAKVAWAKVGGRKNISVQPLSVVEPPVPTEELEAMLQKRRKAAETRYNNERLRRSREELECATRAVQEAQDRLNKLKASKLI